MYSYDDVNQASLSILNLPWETVNETVCRQLGKLDTIIAADIVYDSELFESLIDALKNLSKFSGVLQYIFCCTVRNPSTFEEFLVKMGK